MSEAVPATRKLGLKGQMNVAVDPIIRETERAMRGLSASGTDADVHPHIYLKGYLAGVKALQDIVLRLDE